MFEIIDDIVRRAGRLILDAEDIQSCVEEKTSRSDLVTKYDPMVQEFLRKELLRAFPDAGFLGEEEKEHDTAGHTMIFIVDPIDGTTNFIRGFNYSCISVACSVNGIVEYGVVYNPYTNEFFSAQKGCGAFLNFKRIHTNHVGIDHSLVYLGTAIYYRDTLDLTTSLFSKIFPMCQDIRRGGSAALDICYIAAGRADMYFECILQPWDYAAASLIVEEAGGVASAMDGKPLRLDTGCSVAIGTAENHTQLLTISAQCADEMGYQYLS